MTINEIQKAIEAKQKELDNFELDNDDYEEQYRDAINEDGPVVVCGLGFERVRVLKELDPTAYRCGLNDFVDGMEKEDDPKYKELEEELEDLESELEDAESEASEKEAEAENK